MTPQQIVIVAVLALIAVGMGNAPRIRARNLRALRRSHQKRMHEFVTKHRGRRT